MGRLSKINFTAGQLSPFLNARNDLAQYQNGASKLQNVNILPFGGVQKRQGTKFIRGTHDTSIESRLHVFEADVNNQYLLEFNHLNLTICNCSNDTVIEANITTVYNSLQDLTLIRTCQVNDVMYVVHPKYPVYKLTRNPSDGNWSFNIVNFSYAPMLLPNADPSINIQYNGVGLVTNGSIFNNLPVGSYFTIKFPIEGENLVQSLDTSATSNTIYCNGKFYYASTGTWTGQVKVDYSIDNGATWINVLTFDANNDRTLTGEQDIGITADKTTSGYIQLRISNTHISHTGTPKFYLWTNSYTSICSFITTGGGTNSITATLLEGKPKVNAKTSDFYYQAFSDATGYPNSVILHQQRLCFGGTAYYPQTVWMSQTDDFENFLTGIADTDAITYTIAAQDKNSIVWMQSAKSLIIGTLGGEFTVEGNSGVSSAGLITPSAVSIKRQSNFGCYPLEAIKHYDKVLYIQRTRNKLREIAYDIMVDGYLTEELSLFAEDITKVGIRRLALQTYNYNIVYMPLDDGSIATMTYERGQKINAFSRFVFNIDGGNQNCRDCLIVRTPTGDVLYTIMKNTTNNTYSIEKLDVSKNRASISTNYYLDGYKISASNSNTDTLSSLAYSSAVYVFDVNNGSYYGPFVANSSGTFSIGSTLINGINKIPIGSIIGRLYTAKIETMPIDVGSAVDSRKAKYDIVPRINVLMYQTGDCFASGDNGISLYKTKGGVISSTDYYSGDNEVYIKQILQHRPIIHIESNVPHPLTLLNIDIDYVNIER